MCVTYSLWDVPFSSSLQSFDTFKIDLGEAVLRGGRFIQLNLIWMFVRPCIFIQSWILPVLSMCACSFFKWLVHSGKTKCLNWEEKVMCWGSCYDKWRSKWFGITSQFWKIRIIFFYYIGEGHCFLIL